MVKHAYLLMVHEQNEMLQILLSLLDDERNDIFIHVDKKCREFSQEEVRAWIKKSNLCFTKRISVVWGDKSLVRAELMLLEEATRIGHYAYYHLLSASDLPLKSQDDIHSWFLKHSGKEFVHFGTEEYQKGIISRYKVYHLFQKKIGRYGDNQFYHKLYSYSLAAQRRLHVDRTKYNRINMYGGSEWFSITHELAIYLLKEMKKYKREFRFVQMADEIFLQSIVMNSPYKDNLYLPGFLDDYHSVMRYIDWERGKNGGPHTFTIGDYEDLVSSDYLFARKFNLQTDREVVEKIVRKLKQSLH